MAVSDYSMFDVQTEREQQRHKTAYEVAQIPRGRVPIYASSAGGDIYNEGLMGLAGMLGGAPDPATGKQQAIAEIQARFPNPDTFEEFMELANAFSMGGFYSFAEAAIKAANETRASMPAVAEKTDFQSNYEYVMNLPEEQRDEAMQLWKPAASTDDWSDYLKTDTTPTGEEYLAFLTAQGKDATQTTNWKDYSNTTDTPTKAGFAVWLDRNQKLQTFASAEQLELSLLYADPAFLIAPTEKREELIDAIELKYQDIKTFTQNGVVYDAHTSTAMIEGSKEIIPTTIVGGRVYDARTMELLNDTGVKRKMVKREDKKWYYEDNGERVFKNDLAISDPELKAAEIYAKPEYKNVVTDESVRIAVANELVKEGLAGTDVFTNLMSHISEDGTRAIQAENLIVKSIERLGESFVKSGVGTMDSILTPLEDEISDRMTQVRRADGKIFWTGDLPGWGLVKKAVTYMPGEKGYEAREFAGKAMSLINTVLKQRSGAAVTESEWKRLQDEYATGITTAAQFASWVTRIREYTEKTRMNVMGAYQPIVVNRYMANQGIYTVLDNPDDPVQRNQIPLNGFYQDKNGTIYQRTE